MLKNRVYFTLMSFDIEFLVSFFVVGSFIIFLPGLLREQSKCGRKASLISTHISSGR